MSTLVGRFLLRALLVCAAAATIVSHVPSLGLRQRRYWGDPFKRSSSVCSSSSLSLLSSSSKCTALTRPGGRRDASDLTLGQRLATCPVFLQRKHLPSERRRRNSSCDNPGTRPAPLLLMLPNSIGAEVDVDVELAGRGAL